MRRRSPRLSTTAFTRDAALRSSARFAAAGAAGTAAYVHLLVLEDHFEEAPYVGVLFALFSFASIALAVLLARRDTRFVWGSLGGICAAAIVLLIWSRAIGLPQLADDVGQWTEPLALVAGLAELLVVILAAHALAGTRSGAAPRNEGLLPIVVGGVILAIGVAGSAAAGSSGDGHTHAAATGHTGMQMNAAAQSEGGYWNDVGGQRATRPTGVTRTYFVAADEVVWDYAPDGRNQITGEDWDETAKTYVQRGPGRIGSRNLKCLYHGYTDASFRTQLQRSQQDGYMGFLGPVIRAEVGDTIKVVYRNNCSIPTSVHPHGVFYAKSSEGAPYNDGTSAADKLDDAVPQGGSHTYTWQVPERAGPGPGDGSSVMWMYHSHTDEVGDTYAGLMGPMEITRRGMGRPDGSPKDVDRELFVLFSVMNENQSPYLPESYKRFAEGDEPLPEEDDEFEEANLKHSMNGYMYGNGPMITIRRGQRVRWYTMSMGTEVDLHTPHWHGNTVVSMGMRMDTVSLLPAGMVTADMVPDDAGTWLFHCHVNDHLTAGMITRYTVTP